MGGPDGRLAGLVADSAIRSMSFDRQNGLYVAGISDGGNTVIRKDPRDYLKQAPEIKRGFGGMRGRVLYVGHLMRLDGDSRELLSGTGLGSYGKGGYQATWAVDITPLPASRVLTIGRHGQNYPSTPDAWFNIPAEEGMFLKVLNSDFEETFSVNIPHAIPYTATCHGSRGVVVGIAESSKTPVKNPFIKEHSGGLDGYFMVIDFHE
jgi:hypothetical protein